MFDHPTNRRQFFVTVGSLGAMLAVREAQAQVAANPAAFGAAIGNVTGGAEVKKGRVKLDIPPLSENGNTVATTVTVESPMTAKDYVKAARVIGRPSRKSFPSRSTATTRLAAVVLAPAASAAGGTMAKVRASSKRPAL